MSLCPAQISHGLTWNRNRVCAIISRHSYGRCCKHSVQFTQLIGLLIPFATEVEIVTCACIRVMYGARVLAIYVRIIFILFVMNDAHISDE